MLDPTPKEIHVAKVNTKKTDWLIVLDPTPKQIYEAKNRKSRKLVYALTNSPPQQQEQSQLLPLYDLTA